MNGDSGENFRDYLRAYAAGPAIEYLSRIGAWRAEALVGNMQVLDDDDFEAELRRSGDTEEARLSWRLDNEQGLINLSARVEMMNVFAKGIEYRGNHYRYGIGNVFYFRQVRLAIEGILGKSTFPDRRGGREDNLIGYDALLSWQQTAKLAWLAHATEVTNSSTVGELYSYNRLVFGIGLRFIF